MHAFYAMQAVTLLALPTLRKDFTQRGLCTHIGLRHQDLTTLAGSKHRKGDDHVVDLVVCVNPSSSLWVWVGEGFFWYRLAWVVMIKGLLNGCMWVCVRDMLPVGLPIHLTLFFCFSDSAFADNCAHTHTHPFNGPLSRTTWMIQYRKGKTSPDFTESRDMSGSGISWAICKSAPRSRQITMPAPHHSVFLQAGCPACCPTNSVKALKAFYHSGSHYWALWSCVL